MEMTSPVHRDPCPAWVSGRVRRWDEELHPPLQLVSGTHKPAGWDSPRDLAREKLDVRSDLALLLPSRCLGKNWTPSLSACVHQLLWTFTTRHLRGKRQALVNDLTAIRRATLQRLSHCPQDPAAAAISSSLAPNPRYAAGLDIWMQQSPWHPSAPITSTNNCQASPGCASGQIRT